MKKVIVTGAGSGIGKEFTKLFLEDGSRVLAVSLVQDELDLLADEFAFSAPRLETLQMDLSKADAAQQLLQWTRDDDWFPDTLINNAGFACFGDAVDLSPERVTNMLELNITTLTMTSMLFGREMKERRRGAILNVGSTAGMVPSTRMASYCASKSYVNTFTYALAAELKPFGVTVTCLTPGATQTKFAQAGGIDTFSQKSLLHNMFEKNKAGSPAEVARGGYDALAAGKTQALVGKGSKLAALLSRTVSQRRLPALIKNP
ncbi:SDR family NAD(P)-dependent oxidoreductase [Mycobacterium sp. CVI_P3]|uniref:SDR family NAD(P)-dependent oxidoreductase n=1 Tax=Mycobacterium pinniadriaticum TaxID=2994102 RepID=A0ABT3SBY7_9MYCO|nr:SDR family NAD(P)-dependent oxidoreductase [Mycobacterium pinniadriaticum]MCX2930617.1 SDR family NAD(P)-dependent oxidoreductase [Mycobacterium pinniadriaticum]MCX2937041.1 SDR family NAD(P)-dependent oxidoreductase [Mycobacterium pinniadriaticum]